jgi:hypothetical protein
MQRQFIGAGSAMLPEAGAWLSYTICQPQKRGGGGEGDGSLVQVRRRDIGPHGIWSNKTVALNASATLNTSATGVAVICAPAVIHQRFRA